MLLKMLKNLGKIISFDNRQIGVAELNGAIRGEWLEGSGATGLIEVGRSEEVV